MDIGIQSYCSDYEPFYVTTWHLITWPSFTSSKASIHNTSSIRPSTKTSWPSQTDEETLVGPLAIKWYT
jgi:hypothetical protein